MAESRKQRYRKLLAGLKNERSSFDSHWRELSSFMKPRRLRLSPTDTNRGDKRNQNIIDPTATLAAGTLRAGIASGMTSSASQWFTYSTQDSELAKFGPVKNWLEQARAITASALLKSNFYNVAPMLYGDCGVFGTGCIGIFDDNEDVFRFTPFPLGEYYIANDDKLRVRTFVREFQMTVRQIVLKFGRIKNGVADWSNISAGVKTQWDNGNTEAWITVIHVIEQNANANPSYLASKFKAFSDCYFEMASGDDDVFLSEKGYDKFPIMAARWETAAGDVYGTDCPGMTALGAVKGLQTGEKVSLNAIDKMVRPPLFAPAAMRTSKLNQLPGEISYYPDGVKPESVVPLVNTSQFRVDLLENKQEAIRGIINQAFFVDLFLMLSNMDVKDVTATAVSELKEEKLLMLGPVYGNFDQDFLKPCIDITFDKLYRAGMLPEAPPELQGQPLEVEYTSIMAKAQKAVGRTGMNAFISFAGQWATIEATNSPSLVKVNADNLFEAYADSSGVPPDIIRSDEEAQAIRDQQNQAADQEKTMAALQQGASTAKDLSQASLGGDSALSQLVGANG